jgi:hypothetical protein
VVVIVPKKVDERRHAPTLPACGDGAAAPLA